MKINSGDAKAERTAPAAVGAIAMDALGSPSSLACMFGGTALPQRHDRCIGSGSPCQPPNNKVISPHMHIDYYLKVVFKALAP